MGNRSVQSESKIAQFGLSIQPGLPRQRQIAGQRPGWRQGAALPLGGEINPNDDSREAMGKPVVIIRHCDRYDPAHISRIVAAGLDTLGVRPRGRVLVKPNAVIAHKDFFPHAYTRPEFLDGLLGALRRRGAAVSTWQVGERSGITVPTRFAFAMAGYPAVLNRHRVAPVYFDEGLQVPVALNHPDALRPLIFIPQDVKRCDFLVNAPKFKAHPWTKVTFALKNYIGLQDDAHRLIDHDHMLHTKIADLQEVISPGFIAVDAITAGERTMLTPDPYPLHLIVMGVNPVAVDVVCTHILGLDPREVDHIRISARRGFGPLEIGGIDLRGNVSLEEAQQRAAAMRLTLDRVDRIFNHRSNINAYVGPPPDTYDYCWGGCPGALFEAMQIIKVMQPDVYREVRPLHVILGAYQGRVEVAAGERLLIVGDCAAWKGRAGGVPINAASTYTPRCRLNPGRPRGADVMLKIVAVLHNLFVQRGRPAIRVRGCPVSVAEYVLYISLLGRVKNPYLHPKIVFVFVYCWAVSKLMRFWRVAISAPFIRRCAGWRNR